MYHEEDYIMLSALQHYLFCPRQCALIHLEQTWEENSLTMQGHILHERVHEEKREKRGDVIISRGLRLSQGNKVAKRRVQSSNGKLSQFWSCC